MITLDAQMTVGELVTERPSRSRVFEQLGIDYCCGGKVPLAQACAAKKLSVDQVLEQLQASDAQGTQVADTDWSQAPLSELIDHIVDTHHRYLRRELPRLSGLVAKIRDVHGERHPHLRDVASTFAGLQAELDAHMMKEERILFPMIKQMEQAESRPEFHCGSVGNPIAVMEDEHDSAGRALERMRTLTDGFQPPADACNTYRATLDGLHELETDLHQHIHKENNILFPRAQRREAELGS